MDGTKLVADTIDLRKKCGRQASWLGRSMFEKICGPTWNENPGGSRNIVLRESVPPKGQGFLDNANQSRGNRS
jgi:hypothetical protein